MNDNASRSNSVSHGSVSRSCASRGCASRGSASRDLVRPVPANRCKTVQLKHKASPVCELALYLFQLFQSLDTIIAANDNQHVAILHLLIGQRRQNYLITTLDGQDINAILSPQINLGESFTNK